MNGPDLTDVKAAIEAGDTAKAAAAAVTASEKGSDEYSDILKFAPYESDEPTPETYNVPKGETDLFHVLLDKPNFNNRTGEKLSVAFVQKFTPTDWDAHVKFNTEGFTHVILHSPKK